MAVSEISSGGGRLPEEQRQPLGGGALVGPRLLDAVRRLPGFGGEAEVLERINLPGRPEPVGCRGETAEQGILLKQQAGAGVGERQRQIRPARLATDGVLAHGAALLGQLGLGAVQARLSAVNRG